MLVSIFGENGELSNTLTRVTEVQYVKDGRHLVSYKKKCEHCTQDTTMIYQIPATMTLIVKEEVK